MVNAKSIFSQFRERYGEQGYTIKQIWHMLNHSGERPYVNDVRIKDHAKKQNLAIDLRKEGFEGFRGQQALYMVKKSDLEKLMVSLKIDVSASELEETAAELGIPRSPFPQNEQ